MGVQGKMSFEDEHCYFWGWDPPQQRGQVVSPLRLVVLIMIPYSVFFWDFNIA